MRKRTIRYLAIVCIATCLVSARTILAQDAESAKAFLNSIFILYANHGKGIHQDTAGKCGLSNRYIHSSLLTLIDANIKAVGTDIPIACGADIICNCQEWEGIWVQKMEVSLETSQRAQALVTFTIYAPENRSEEENLKTIQYTLVPEKGQWRIYDISYIVPAGDPGTLRKAIQEDIDYYVHPSQNHTSETQ